MFRTFAGYEGGQFGVSRRSDGFGGDYADAGQSNSSDTFGGVSPTARQNTASLTCLYGSSIYYYSETANSTLLALGWEF